MKKRLKKKKMGAPLSEETQVIQVMEAELIEGGEEFYHSNVEPMLELAVRELLRGTNARKMQEVMKLNNYEIGRDKTYRLIKVAKAEIRRRAEKDFDDNYAWAQQNLMDMHNKAVDLGDDRMRLVVIKELIDLFGLKRQTEAPKDAEITPEMIEQFERALLR